MSDYYFHVFKLDIFINIGYVIQKIYSVIGIFILRRRIKMCQPIPVIYSDGVFKPLKRVDLPPESQIYLIVVITKDDLQEMSTAFPGKAYDSEQKLADLIAELKSDLSEVSESDFKFDKEHRELFLENAKLFAPLVPSMIPEEPSLDEEIDEKVSL
jgi:predicted DNA-binding antitoxin AbrB/MazE fold protein